MTTGDPQRARGATLGGMVASVLVGAVAFASVAAAGASPTTERVSVSSAGNQANLQSGNAAISADGRFVAFTSDATGLVAGDSNGLRDAFVRDRKTDRTRRVSVRSDGGEANFASLDVAISANGRFVAFTSTATNLVAGDTNNASDVFVHDRKTKKTRRVSVRSNGDQALGGPSSAPAISASGRYVAFASEAGNLAALGMGRARARRGSPIFTKIYVHDRKSGKTKLVSRHSNGMPVSGAEPSISADGRFVVFETFEPAVTGDTGEKDVFVRDRKLGKTRRVSVASGGTQPDHGSLDPAISANGRFVAFESLATNLVSNDTNGIRDIFVRDLRRNRTTRANLSSAGGQANGVETTGSASISGDGRFVAFVSQATNLVPGDTNGAGDIFLRDRRRGKTKRVNVSSTGAQATNFFSRLPALSADGRFVAFETQAANLISGDSNNAQDVFVRGPLR